MFLTVDSETMDELLRTPMENTARWITFGAVALTLLVLIVVAIFRDIPVFKHTIFNTQKKTIRATLVRKYMLSEEDMEESRRSAASTGLHGSGLHYMALFSGEGIKKPIALEMKSGEWDDLPDSGEGILEYSGGVLIRFETDKQ